LDDDPRNTAELLTGCHRGDARALVALVQRDLSWVRGHVSHRLGPMLRRREDTQDVIQDTLVEILRSGPRFVVSDRDSFRALVARMVENTIRRGWEHETAGRRDLRREEEMPADETVVTLGAGHGVTRPSEAAGHSEMRARVRLALELLDPDDRRVLVLREYRDLSFGEIAQALGTTEDAARMRFARALPRLARCMGRLQAGRLAELLDEPAPREAGP
jgi:RNA polymerase sigma factor (sigma-70 family)